MREIPLTQGQVALVDDEDFDRINKHKWHAYKTKKDYTFYARRGAKIIGKESRVTILMHREIMYNNGQTIDHKDRNGLNNQKSNLRSATFSQNTRNKKAHGSSSYLGVSLHKTKQKRGDKNIWQANIDLNGISKYLGIFQFEEDAARAYDASAKEIHGEFANLNFKD